MIKIYIDGASRGNPGKIGIGYVIYDENNTEITRKSLCLGEQTNNFAEYMALIFALIEALQLKQTDCSVFSDSQLICEQLNGNYQVKNKNIFPLYTLAKKIISSFTICKISHIGRDLNSIADSLAKKATD